MTQKAITVAVDAMGGDLGPAEVVRGVIQAANREGSVTKFIIVGNEDIIKAELSRSKSPTNNISIQHASQIIEMTDKPREAYRRKPDASVVVCARRVKAGDADAFVTIGNTGAAMAASIFTLRPIQGIDRPAITTNLPSLSGRQVILLDAGANVDCEPEQLLQFAMMGQCYSRTVIGTKAPTVGLLSNGEEESKGNEFTRETHQLLKRHVTDFTGNVEGRQVFEGAVDVVVCDGFDGNILLKTAEGVAEMVMGLLRAELTKHKWMQLCLLPLRNGMRRTRDKIDYREFGGAPLLGINGVCIIGHGRSDARAIVNAIRVAEKSVTTNLLSEIESEVKKISRRAEIQSAEGTIEAK